MDKLFSEPSTKIGFSQMVNTFNTDYKGALQNNVFEHLFSILSFVLTLENSDCLSMGVKVGAILRKTFSYKFIDWR